jgi:hypothetical protein
MNGAVAKRSRGSDSKPLPSDGEGGLSARMRELLLGSKLEERRKAREGDDSGGDRRRGDRIANPADRQS